MAAPGQPSACSDRWIPDAPVGFLQLQFYLQSVSTNGSVWDFIPLRPFVPSDWKKGPVRSIGPPPAFCVSRRPDPLGKGKRSGSDCPLAANPVSKPPIAHATALPALLDMQSPPISVLPPLLAVADPPALYMRCRTDARFRGCGHGVKRIQAIGARDYQRCGAADLGHRCCVSVHLEIIERTAAFYALFLGGFAQRFRGTVAERDHGGCIARVVAGAGWLSVQRSGNFPESGAHPLFRAQPGCAGESQADERKSCY